MDINVISKALTEKLATIGYELVSIKNYREKGNNILGIVVDRVEPIDMNAIVEVSEFISSYLDEIDNSATPYTLDVSSLGAEKPLKIEALKSYVGSYINIHLVNPIDGENIFEGTIKEVNEDNLVLEYRIKTRVKLVSILLSNIYKVRLAIKF